MSSERHPPATGNEPDRRVRRTQSALLSAFGELVLQRPYAEIRVADIIETAQVGRSTFYEHYRGKDDILRHSMAPLLAVMADAVDEDCLVGRLEHVLGHFRENRRVARALLDGEPSRLVARMLTALVEERLARAARRHGREPILPARLAATQIAAGQLGLLRAWLQETVTCTPRALANALHRTSSAVAAQLC